MEQLSYEKNKSRNMKLYSSYSLKIITGSLIVLMAIFICSWKKCAVPIPGNPASANTDSTIDKYYKTIDSIQPFLYDYHEAAYKNNQLSKKLEEFRIESTNATDDSTKAAHKILKIRTTDLKLKDGPFLDTIVLNVQSLERAIAKIHQYRDSIHESEHKLNQNKKALNGLQKEYEKRIQFLNTTKDSLVNGHYFTFKGNKYRVFRANQKEHDVLIWNNPGQGINSTIKNICATLLEKKDTPLMITNGGMYMPDFSAQGLLVVNRQKKHEIDTLKTNNKLNFYLYPNGIFFIDTTGQYGILSTQDYQKKFSTRLPKYATQSGPLLINKGSFNINMSLHSTNDNIRSGVGINGKGELYFLISDTPVNFYDFSIVFSDLFGCKQALYLDGAISKMYINEKSKKELPKIDPDGQFGPMISITKKKIK